MVGKTGLEIKKLLLKSQQKKVAYERELKLVHKWSMVGLEFGGAIFFICFLLTVFVEGR